MCESLLCDVPYSRWFFKYDQCSVEMPWTSSHYSSFVFFKTELENEHILPRTFYLHLLHRSPYLFMVVLSPSIFTSLLMTTLPIKHPDTIFSLFFILLLKETFPSASSLSLINLHFLINSSVSILLL